MRYDYEWDKASKLWLVTERLTGQVLSRHWTSNEAKRKAGELERMGGQANPAANGNSCFLSLTRAA